MAGKKKLKRIRFPQFCNFECIADTVMPVKGQIYLILQCGLSIFSYYLKS